MQHCHDENVLFWREESENTIATENEMDINAIELKAVLFVVRAFTKTKEKCHVHIKVYNTTMVTWWHGGTKCPNTDRDIPRTVDVLYVQADHAYSRTCPRDTEPDSSRKYVYNRNWKLDVQICQGVVKLLEPVVADLFTDRTNAQTKTFVSWKPHSVAYITDAFIVQWIYLNSYTFPPFC